MLEGRFLLEEKYYLGVDVGSVSTNIVIIDRAGNVCHKLYLKTGGNPVEALKKGLGILADRFDGAIAAAGATGSGRQLAGMFIGADVIKNEITAHAVAACAVEPSVRTIIEIGGQDSKIIFVKERIVTDFAMNTVCAAGTGSFLDRQASRLDIPIEEFGRYALKSKNPVRIAGRCAVFAESDMIHKQQTGHCSEDIIAGLCEALARNYVNNLAKGKIIEEPVVFQGGVAANVGMVAAFEKLLEKKLIIPKYFDVMGALGAAILAKEEIETSGKLSEFRGFAGIYDDFSVTSLECRDCANMCEIIRVSAGKEIKACWGDRCGKWSSLGDRLEKNA